MRVFVAGASGAVGSRLVPQLVERGHDVVGTTRWAEKMEKVAELGAEPVVLDLLDPPAVLGAVRAVRPDAIAHEATALAGLNDLKHFDRSFALTNQLRTAGRTRWWRPRARSVSTASSHRASRVGRPPVSRAGSAARRIRSTGNPSRP